MKKTLQNLLGWAIGLSMLITAPLWVPLAAIIAQLGFGYSLEDLGAMGNEISGLK